MPIQDKVAAANRINEYLKTVLALGGLRLKYRITVSPDDSPERPLISVELAGPDSSLLLERGSALLNSLELLAVKIVGLPHHEHHLVSFDSGNTKAGRQDELRLAAEVAAEKVRKTNVPYQFAPMNSRERRLLHVELAKFEDLRTESTGEGFERSVVLYPKDYKSGPPARPSFARRRR